MIRHKFSFGLRLLVLLCLFSSFNAFAQQAASNSPSPPEVKSSDPKSDKGSDYRIGPGDVLVIEFTSILKEPQVN